jgi:hypothetical protein
MGTGQKRPLLAGLFHYAVAPIVEVQPDPVATQSGLTTCTQEQATQETLTSDNLDQGRKMASLAVSQPSCIPWWG